MLVDLYKPSFEKSSNGGFSVLAQTADNVQTAHYLTVKRKTKGGIKNGRKNQ